jgi:hypothetical protein
LTNIIWIIPYLACAIWCYAIAELGGKEDVVALTSLLEPSADRGGGQ